MNKTKDECTKWLAERGLSTSGSVHDLQVRINKTNLYPSLGEKLKRRKNRSFEFDTSLKSHEIPSIKAAWTHEETLYPKVTKCIFQQYASKKTESSMGQQLKAYKMLSSRKIVSVKTCQTGNDESFVKAMIRESYGQHPRPAVIKFMNDVPLKDNCLCAIGVSGLCCHVLAILLYLKHHYITKEKILELSCTEQLQIWHRRAKKGSLPMLPLNQLKAKSAKPKKNVIDSDVIPADPIASTGRSVLAMKDRVRQKIRLRKPFEQHCYEQLMASKIDSSLKGHLHYRYTLKTALSLADHDYIKQMPYDKEVITIPEGKKDMVVKNISRTLAEKLTLNPEEASISTIIATDDIQEQLSSASNVININLRNIKSYNLQNMHNHINTTQNTHEWLNLRKGKVTGSRLPALLGSYGSAKFDQYWKIVNEQLNENDVIKFIPNFERGHAFEETAFQHFICESGATAIKCGFLYLVTIAITELVQME